MLRRYHKQIVHLTFWMSEPVFIDVLNTTGTIRVYLFNTTELEPFNLDNTDIEKFVESVSKTTNGKI